MGDWIKQLISVLDVEACAEWYRRSLNQLREPSRNSDRSVKGDEILGVSFDLATEKTHREDDEKTPSI